MKDKTNSESTQQEATAHPELEKILKKQRDESSRKIVERILHSDLSVEDQIREIEKLDSKERKTTDSPFSSPFSVIKSVIKHPHAEEFYLRYLLHHHRMCRDFGKETHVVTRDIFPPRVRLNEEVQHSFQKYLQVDAAELLQICEHVLETGWRHLDKMQYNLIVVLQKLCYELISINFRVLNYKDRNLINHFRTLETFFFVLHYKADYTDILIDSIGAVIEKDVRIKQKKDTVANLVGLILGRTDSIPSLYNFILGANMVKCRRFFSLDDLVCRDLGEILNTQDFACKPDMKKKIDRRIGTLRKDLADLKNRYRAIDHLKSVLSFTESGEIDYSGLRVFYDNAFLRGASLNFLADQKNLMVLGPRMLKVFDAVFYPLLAGSIILSDLDEVSLFKPDFFQREFEKLQGVAKKTDEMAYTYHSLLWSRFETLKMQGEKAIPKEAAILQMIDDGFASVLKIGKTLEGILSSTHRKGSQDSSVFPADGPLVTPGRDFSIPEKEIDSNSYLNGKTVDQALADVVQICYAAAAFFHNRDTLGILNREESIKKNLSQQTEALKRIADSRKLKEFEAN